MSAVDEARALLAVPSTRRFMTTVDHTEFALIDAAPRLLAALCAEVEAARIDAELARRYRAACARTDAASEADEAAQTEASGAARKEAWIAQGRALDALVRGAL